MSKQVNKEVICPECDHHNKSILWTGMNVTVDKDLREQVLSERLFDWRCERCGFAAQLVYPCLYHDMDKKFMIYLLPDSSDARLEDMSVDKQFPELKIMRRRVVSTLNELKEKILIFEARLDDLANEITKLAVINVVERKYNGKISSGYFCTFNKSQKTIGYSFLMEGRRDPLYYETRIQVYEKSREIVREYLQYYPIESGFSRIDADWAGRVMEKLALAARNNG